jgi:hypothetical protein
MNSLCAILGLTEEKKELAAEALLAELRQAYERIATYEARIIALDKELSDAREDCERLRNALYVALNFRIER